MGNEFGAADFQPHLIPAIIYEREYDLCDSVAGTTLVVVAGGYHPKMRLRYASVAIINEDVAADTTPPQMNVLHGSNEVVAAHAFTTGDVIGTYDELTIIDTYKDVAASEQIAIEVDQAGADAAASTGYALVHLEYELVE